MFRSLKATLMVWVVALIVLLVPLRLYFELGVQLRRTAAAYDVSLSDWALALGNLVRVVDGRVTFNLNEQTEQSLRTTSTQDMIFYVVLDADGQRLAGDEPLARLPLKLVRGERRLFDGALDGRPVRIAAHAVPCGAQLCQVRVAETPGKRDAARGEALRFALLFALAFGIVLAVAIWLAVTRAMRPLASINEQLAQRSLEDLRPLGLTSTPEGSAAVASSSSSVPSEVAPLVRAIDQLLQRVAGDAAQQRHFIADAAHQLRTPLAALHAEAELALLEQHPPAVHATLQRMHRSTRRVTRLADQLLALARSEATARARDPGEPFDLKRVAQDAAQDWVPRALARGADLGFQLDSVTVKGHRHLVSEMLANLLHNALEYAAADAQRPARITVRTGMARQRAMLEVEDNGPGIAAAERPRVFERFYRAPGSPGGGSGLGLSIVEDIARAHGASVELLDADEGPGLKVRVTF